MSEGQSMLRDVAVFLFWYGVVVIAFYATVLGSLRLATRAIERMPEESDDTRDFRERN